jgi:hypothetical protein
MPIWGAHNYGRKQEAGENITEVGYKFDSILIKDDLGIKDS